MSEHQAGSGDNSATEFGRDQRRGTTPEGRRVESRDRAPEVYVEGEQVARLVENRRVDVGPVATPEAPGKSWFDDDVPPAAAPAGVATLVRTSVEVTRERGTEPERNGNPGVDSVVDRDNNDRVLDEFEVVIRGFDEPDSAMNAAFPRLGNEAGRDFFDPASFGPLATNGAPGEMMRPAVEQPGGRQADGDLSGVPKPPPEFADPAAPIDFGTAPDTVMRPAVEPQRGDSRLVDLDEEGGGRGMRTPVESGENMPSATAPSRGLPTDGSTSPVDTVAPDRAPDTGGRGQLQDDGLPVRRIIDDPLAGSRGSGFDDPISRVAPPTTSRQGESTAGTGDKAADSLDVFTMQPVTQAFTQPVARQTPVDAPARTPATTEELPVTEPTRVSEAVAGRGFFDDAPARESGSPGMPASPRDPWGMERPEDETRSTVVEETVAASRFDGPEIGTEDLAPFSFDDEDTLDNE